MTDDPSTETAVSASTGGEPGEPVETDARDALDDRPLRATRNPWPGVVALVLAVVVVVLDAVALAVAVDDAYDTATVLAFTAIGVSVLGVVLALVAILARAGRWWGVAALALCVLANPVVMTSALGALSGLTA